MSRIGSGCAAVTVTANVSDTVPPLPSLAVTVMVAVPLAFAVAISVEPSAATNTADKPVTEDAAFSVSASLSGSLNTAA